MTGAAVVIPGFARIFPSACPGRAAALCFGAALRRAAVFYGAAALCCGAAGARPDPASWAELRKDLASLNAALADSSTDLGGLIAELAGDRVDHGRFTRLVFRDYCEKVLKEYGQFMSGRELDDFVDRHQERLQREFRAHWVPALAAYLREGSMTSLHLAEIDEDGDEAEVEIAAETGPGRKPRTLTLELRAEGGDWRIVDVETDDLSASELLRRRFEEILDNEYSLPVLEAQMRQRSYIVLEDFSTTEPGNLPEGWGWRDRDRDKPKPYAVLAAGDHRFLAARDSGSSIIFLKFSRWNPRQYPILTWCWRAESLPPGGDERYGPTNDSAAGLYVFFSQNWLGIPRQIKYVWSTTLPEGTVDRRKRFARPWFFVVETGSGNLGRWVFEQVDLLADYDRVYGGEPKSRTRGLGILTDANSTRSYAEAHYADLRVWTREALERGEVRNHCECLPAPPVTAGPGPAGRAGGQAAPGPR